MKIFKTVLVIFSLLILTAFKTVQAQDSGNDFQIETGELETVFDWKTQKCPQDRDIPDAPARAFVDNEGNVQLVAADEKLRRNIGPNLDDLQHRCEVVSNSHRNPEPRMYDDVEWLTSPYTLDGRTIYSFIHNEYHGWEHNDCNQTGNLRFSDCWWNSINLAYSTDGGASFFHFSPPTHNILNSPLDYNPSNAQGMIGYSEPSNIIFKDGYYYSIFVARNNPPNYQIHCLMRSSDLSDPKSWRLWDGRGFNIIGDRSGGHCRECPQCPECQECTSLPNAPHQSISYNTYLGKYLAIDCYWHFGGCQYSLSDDLIHWTPRRNLPLPAAYDLYSYGSLLQPGNPTRNFDQTDRSPWLYFTSHASETNNQGYNLSRIRLRLTKPGDENRYELLDLQMNEKKGTKTLDSSFYSNNGVLSNGLTFREENENFLHFNGSGKVEVAHSSSLNASSHLTIEVRIRTSVSPSEEVFPTIIRKENSLGLRNYGLYITDGGVLYFSLTENGGFSDSLGTKKINDGQWHKIKLTYDDMTGKATYYVDDQLEAERYHQAKLQDGINSSPVFIGDRGFIGDIDYLVVYNYVEDSPLVPTPTPPLIYSQCLCPSGLNKLQTGDANCDEINNILDFGIWSNEFIDFGNRQLDRSLWRSDFNCDQIIDIRDFEIWRNQWAGD